MRLRLLLALVLLFGLGATSQAQSSPYSNVIFKAQTFTATGQTGTPIQLNGLVVSSTVGSSFASGTITVTGSSLTTATFSVQGSSDGGATYYALPISAVASPGATPTLTVTATANALYQINLAGLTHVRFVTSGTFTATNVILTLTASPNGQLARAGTGSGITQLTGDISTPPSGSGVQTATLPTVNAHPGTCGDSTHVCVNTTNAKGLVTDQSTVAITATGSGSNQVVYVSQKCSGTAVDPTIGLTAAGGTATDYGACINGLITTAAGSPLKIVFDQSVLTSNIHLPPAGNVTLEGLGEGIANTTITNCSVTSNVATLTAKNSLKAGQNVLFSGLGTCSFMNVAAGESAPYFTVSATGLSSTSFQVAVTHANVSGTEAGFASFLYGTWLFAKPGTNNDLVNVAPDGTLRPLSPNTAPPGRGSNITIRNLGLNGNRGNGSDGNSTTGDPRGNLSVAWYSNLHIWDMENVLIDGVISYNSPSFNLILDNTGHVKIINSEVHAFLPGQSTAATNQDGFHINGYNNDIYIANDYLRTGDDAIALNAPEGYCGPITRVVANNLTFKQVRQFGRAYTFSANCSSGVSPVINYVAFDNWVGSAVGADAFAFGFTSPTGSLANSIDHFTWSNSRLSSSTGFIQTDTVGSLTFDNVKLVDLNNGGFFNYGINFGTSTVGNLTFTNDAIVRTSAGHSVSGLVAPWSVVSHASIAISNLNVRGFKLEDEGGSWGAMSWLLNGFSSTIGNLTYDYDTTNITTLLQGFTVTTTSTLSLPNIAVASCTGCGSFPSWAQITAGIATTLAQFPGGDLFFGGTNAQSGTSYTVLASDENKLLTFNNASPVAVTLAQATTAGFTSGAEFRFVNLGAGTVTITPTTSTINGGSTWPLKTGQSVRLTSDGTNYAAEPGGGVAMQGSSPITVTGNGTPTSPFNVACPTCGTGTGGTSVSQNSGSAETNLPITGYMPQVCSDTSGSGTAQSCSVANTFVPQAGNCVVYQTTTSNTGTALTLNVNGSGAKSVAVPSATGWTTTLAAGNVPANKPMNACYDGANWNASGTGFIGSAGASGALTNITSLLTPTNCTIASGACTISSPVASFTLAGIPAGYKAIRIVVTGTVATAASTLTCQFNGDTAANYAYWGLKNSNGSNVTLNGAPTATPNCGLLGTLGGSSTLNLPQYTNTNFPKEFSYVGGAFGSVANSASNFHHSMSGIWTGTAAITSVKVSCTNNLGANDTIVVYGEN